MSENNEKPNPPGINWKFFLGLALFIAYVIGVHVEKNSPSGEANRRQIYESAQRSMYQETYDSCSGTASEADCREQAKDAKEMTRRKLGPMLGQ
jgi:hypothetical protein